MNSGKKLVIHLAKFFEPHLGGVETHVGELVKFQRSKGWRPMVVTSLFDKKLPTIEVVDGVEIHRIKTGSKLQVWRAIWQLKKLLAEADEIHIHDVAWWLTPLWPIYRHRITLTFHGWEGQYPIPRRNIWQRRLWSAWANRVIHVGAWIEEFYGDRPDRVIYGGVKKSEIIKSDQIKIPEPQKIKIAFIGRLEAVNAIEHYLELVQKLDAEVRWVGDGSYRRQCQRVGEVTGMVTDLISEIDQADIILANSYLSIWQALARGKLVVSLWQHDLKRRYLETFPAAEVTVMDWAELKRVTEDKKEWRRRVAAGLRLAEQHTWEQVFQ